MIHKVQASDSLEYFPWAKKRFEKKYDLKKKYSLKKIEDKEYISLEHTAALLGETVPVALELLRELPDVYAIELGSNLFIFAPSLQNFLIEQMAAIMRDLQGDPKALMSEQLAPKDIA